MQNPLHAHSANQLIEEYIGTAYENVKELAKQLDAIVNLNTNLTDITAVAANLNTLNQLALDAENLASNLGTFNQDASNALSDLSSALATALNTFNTTSNESIEEYSAAANEAISNIEDITQANISDIYEFFTATGYINLYSGEDVPSLSLLNEIMAGWTVVGAFGDVDVELTTRNQIFIDDNGDTWRYTGDLPYTVPDTATSTDIGWFPHELNRPTLTGRLLFTDIANEFITADINRIETIGYSTNGDKGAAYYKRVISEPSHTLKAQSLDGGWWELDETEVYIEMAGGGVGVTDNSVAFSSIMEFLPNRIMPGITGSGPRSFHGSNRLQFKEAGPYKFSQKLEINKDKALYLYDATPHRVQLQYTGPDKVAILFAPGGAQSAYGILNIDVKGGCVAIIGGANGGLMVKTSNLTQSRGKQLWLTDAAIYHDLDYPAVDVFSMTETSPVRIQTTTAHGLTTGDYFGLTDCLGEERINGKYYADVISSNLVDLYTDTELLSPLDGRNMVSTNLTEGLLTKGYPVNTVAAGWNTVWPTIEDVTIANCLEEGLVVESSTFLLAKLGRLRINSTGKSSIALDCNGILIPELEVQGVNIANVEDVVDLHIRCRHNPPSYIEFGSVRLGPEDTSAQSAGPDNVPTVYSSPRRRICLGPLDGSASNKSGASFTFDQLKCFGHNGTSPSTTVIIDENAVINDINIRDGYITYVDTYIIKETAKAAGRVSGNRKIIGRSLQVQSATVTADWYSEDGSGWINEVENSPSILGVDQSDIVITPQGGMGILGTTSISAGHNDRCFTLTINTAESAVSGTNVCTLALPGRYLKTPIPSITPGDSISVANPLAGFMTGNTPKGRILNLKSGSTLPSNTTLKYHINMFEPA